MRFEFENHGSNQYLVYQLQNTDKVDTVALQMLNHNKIPNVLPVSFTQINAERFFRYSELPNSTLRGVLSGVVTRSKMLTIIGSIADAIISTDEYLLDGTAFLLDEDYIFVDNLTGRTKIVYMPLISNEHSVDYVAFFKRVITSIIPDQTEDGSYITTILFYLNSTENFSLNDFAQKIAQLKGASAHKQSVEKRDIDSKAEEQRYEVRREVRKEIRRKPEPKNSPEIDNRKPQAPADIEEKLKKLNSKEIPGKEEEDNTEDSILGFDIPGMGKVTEDKKKNIKKEKKTAESEDKMSMLYLLRNFSGENLERYKQQRSTRKEDEEEIITEVKPGKRKKKQKAPSLVLVSINSAKPVEFVIDKDEFKIGRKSDTNDGVIKDLISVSRDHFKIIKENDDFFVIDRNSAYGTIVDGVGCVPGKKSAPLQEGSIIKLKEISFRVEFR